MARQLVRRACLCVFVCLYILGETMYTSVCLHTHMVS